MTDWISELRDSISREHSGRPAIATLSTVRMTPDGPHADARSVVVRKLMNDGTLLITSDGRSEKSGQIRANPSATAVFWFPSLRKQFVVDGKVLIIGPADEKPIRLQAWRDLSNSTRAMFHWPASGSARNEMDLFCEAIDADAAMPDSFEVLLLEPEKVDILDLNPFPHSRLRWSFVRREWSGLQINP
jgi:hypothetical protein